MAFNSSAALTSKELPPLSLPSTIFDGVCLLPKSETLTAVITAATIEIGAPDEGAVEVASVLAAAGHHPIVVSAGGRLEANLQRMGIEFVRMNLQCRNPVTVAWNTAALRRLMRSRNCNVVHAHDRPAGWTAFLAARLTGVPFLTSWYKGYREQNGFKHRYNSVMARGDRIITGSEQLAALIAERHPISQDRITVIPASVDFDRFDPGALTTERVDAARKSWGAQDDTRIILVADRLLRRKGHHVVIKAARRLKELGLRNFLFIFAGEDLGRTRYTGELWDLVLATQTADVIRMAGVMGDVPATFAAATAVVSAAVQPEGLQRSILEGLAMARPVIVSNLAAGPEIIRSPPAVPENRMTGLCFTAGDDAALAAAVIKFFALPETARAAMGRRGREWALAHCDRTRVAGQILAVYGSLVSRRR